MSKALSLESLTKKLKNVTNTQDSIPMFSLWIIHHKANHELIVNTWLEILKTSKPKHRLTLLYLANDVIQSCKRKKAEIFKEDFANILPEAISFLRDKFILPGVERVLKVWMNRNVYDAELIDQLHAALLTNRPPDTLRQKLLAEYKTSSLIDSISDFKKEEDAIVVEEKQLRNIHIDASSSDNIHKLKDKVGGEIFSRNFEESATNIERFIVQYEKFVQERKSLVDDLSQGEVFYRAQYHEAKIVVNAYQSFDARVSKMKKLLDQVKLKFSPKTPPTVQNPDNDVADMDMSDSDQELGNKPSKIVAVDTNRNAPAKSASTLKTVSKIPQPNHQTGTFVNRPGMRGASTSSLFSSSSPMKAPSANINIPVSFNGALSASLGSKISTPSASPPSPEGSPDLNISSPPRYPSLESRLADLFSGGAAKVNLRPAPENTGSESDADSITIAAKHISPKVYKKSTSDSAHDNAKEAKDDTSVPISEAEDTSTSWQNTIPVIGGNRRPSRETNFMDALRALQPGGSTPLQDESNSETENFQHEKFSSSGSKSVEPILPPPSFSGDALHFLTKFMGQQTNTTLSQAVQPPSTQVTTSSSTDMLQNLNIDWNSIQSITASVGRWPPRNASAFTSATEQQTQALPQISREQDTDYRTTAKNSTSVSNDGTSCNTAASQFRDILRKKSLEPLPNFAPSDDVIVEEEEILVDDDGAIRLDADAPNNNQVHLNNLKNIPVVVSESVSPPPIASTNNMFQFGRQKRPRDEDFRQRIQAFSMMPVHHVGGGRPTFPPRHRMLQRPRMQSLDLHRPSLRGFFRPRMPYPGEGFRGRRNPRNHLADAAFAEDEYYDMLYDELRPKYPRPSLGNRRPRRPYR